MHWFLTTVLVSCCWSSIAIPADGARLLLLAGNINSHVSMVSRIGVGLAALGHDVRVLAPSSARVPDFVERRQQQHQQHQQKQQQVTNNSPTNDNVDLGGQFNYTTFEVDDDKPFVNLPETSQAIVDAALTKSVFMRFIRTAIVTNKAANHWEADGRRLVENKTIIDDLRKSQFDFVIIDMLSVPYFFIPQLLFGVPYGIIASSGQALALRVPRLPSFTANGVFGSGDPIKSFSSRFANFFSELALYAAYSQYQVTIRDGEDGETDSYSKLTVTSGIQNASLLFLMDDIALGDAMPNMPNSISIGDIVSGRPGLPLPDDLEQFMAGSKGGVVVVSFGTYCDFLPDSVSDKLCDTFRRLQLDGRRVVWKSVRPDVCAGVENVRVVPWIPQNDLLADQRVVLFVTHGGFNSIAEAVYHAKPMIVFPVYMDQPLQADAAETKGYAIRMDLNDFTADSLLDKINTMLTDASFVTNVRLASQILRDRHDTPAERISHMIDHVIKYGDKHLRSRAVELNVFQYFMLDVFVVIFAAMSFSMVTFWLICRYACCKRRSSLAKDKRD